MTDPSSASSEPLRRRRSRDRAAGAAAEDDSWAHLVGVGLPWETDGGEEAAAPVPPPLAAGEGPVATDPSPRPASGEPPLSRRAARRREAVAEAASGYPDEPSAAAASGGIPLRPWWAATAGQAAPGGEPPFGGRPPAGSEPQVGQVGSGAVPPTGPAPSLEPDLPSAFRRPDSPAVPPIDRGWDVLAPTPASTAPEPPPAPRLENAPEPPVLAVDEPQVNPWPGQVRPAVRPPAPDIEVRRLQPQRTSDVTVPRRQDDVTALDEVVLPLDIPAARLAPGARGASSAPSGARAASPAYSPAPVFGAGPLLPPAELPGPVLPGVEQAAAATGSTASAAAPPAAPLSRRRARALVVPDTAVASGPATAPTPVARGAGAGPDAGAVPQADAPAAAASAARVRAPRAERPETAGTASALRRRLTAAPTRFPALGPSGEVVDDVDMTPRGAASAATAARPTALAPSAARPETRTSTSTILPSRRGPRPAARGRATPTAGLALPTVSGPAPGALGSGGLRLPGLPSVTGAAAGRVLGAPLGVPSAGAAPATGGVGAGAVPVSGAFDAVAGIGGPGRGGSRRPDAGRARGRSNPRTPLRAVGDADLDETTRTIQPVGTRAAAAGRDDPPSSRRAARAEETSVGRAVGDETALGPAKDADETAITRTIRPQGATGGPVGLPGDPGAGGEPDRQAPPRAGGRRAARAAQTGETPQLTPVPSPAAGRAGRNLPAAIGVGVGLGAAVVASLLIRKEAFVLVVAAAMIMALWELTAALRHKRIEVPLVPLAVGTLGMLVSAFVAGEDGLLVSFTLTCFGVLLWRIIDGHEGATRDVAASVFVAAYVPFLAGFSMLMLAMPDGALRVITFIAVTVSNDIGGYATGVLAGRHPMAPTISPKKSWEGLAGSVLLCMVVGAGTVHVLLHGSLVAGLALGAVSALTATLGDLSESLVKRDLGIKDMGSLLPGHGGIMDRLDSLLPTAPAAYLLLLLLVPVH